jgi:hypothetical protein
MHYIKSPTLTALIFLLLGCAGSPATTPIPSPPTATATMQLATLAEPSASARVLEAGQWTYIFYHEELGQVVLVNGGPERGKPADDPLELWGWDGVQWSLLSADEDGPVWRNWAAVAYDPERNVLVIHGGLQPARENFDETWEWDGGRWTRYASKESSPGALEGALMAYDAEHGNIVLFGGSTPDLEIHGDTWTWDGQGWLHISDAGPAPRFPGGLVYDAARQEILMYSGHFAAPAGEFIQFDDLWAWDGSEWQEIVGHGPTPGHRTHSGLVYDPLFENVLLIGGGSDRFLGDIWVWDGTSWTDIATSEAPLRSGHNVAYDPSRDRFVLFGGVDRPGGRALTDTWEWDRAQWECVRNCQ